MKKAKRRRGTRKKIVIHADCKHFRGDVPCRPHKEHGVRCDGCAYYERQDVKILIIKLGAAGDVIRTTPLLTKLRETHPHSRIYWMTHHPMLIPSLVDVVLDLSVKSMVLLEETPFDVVFNLDKDPEACAVASKVRSRVKKGFLLRDGKPAPADAAAEGKFLAGIFDDIGRANRKSYVEEMFGICGFPFHKEEYILDVRQDGEKWDLNRPGTIVGLNTGCGARWPSRLWDVNRWAELARALKQKGYEVVLLGGEDEDGRNRIIQEKSGAKYFGYFPLDKFIALIQRIDVLVTGVTMALHIGLGLKKKVVLLNNIFNPHEFELYGRGVIVEPDRPCHCFYAPTCTNPDYFCMDHLGADKLLREVERMAGRKESSSLIL